MSSNDDKAVVTIAHAAVALRKAEELAAVEKTLHLPTDMITAVDVDRFEKLGQERAAIDSNYDAAEKAAKLFESKEGFAKMKGGIGRAVAEQIREEVVFLREWHRDMDPTAEEIGRVVRDVMKHPSDTSAPAPKSSASARGQSQ